MTSTALHRPPTGKASDKQARSRVARQPDPALVATTTHHRAEEKGANRSLAQTMTKTPDPFRYGWRFEQVQTADGGVELREVPLTWQDILDPKEGDYMIQATVHTQIATGLLWMLSGHFEARDDVAVFYDLKMLWDIPGLSQPGPDIAVVPNIRDKGRNRSSFDVVREGTRPCLIIEVVSPEYRNKDYRDLPHTYEQAGIDEYLIVDPGPNDSDAALRLSGYRLDASGRYRPMEADDHGRLFSATTDLYFGSDPVHRRLVVQDAGGGQPLLHPEQQRAALKDNRRRAANEALARQQAELRAAEATERTATEARARRQAELHAAEEAAARRALQAELEQLRNRLKTHGE